MIETFSGSLIEKSSEIETYIETFFHSLDNTLGDNFCILKTINAYFTLGAKTVIWFDNDAHICLSVTLFYNIFKYYNNDVPIIKLQGGDEYSLSVVKNIVSSSSIINKIQDGRNEVRAEKVLNVLNGSTKREYYT